MRANPFVDSRRRSGTARRDQYGRLVPGEFDQYDQPAGGNPGLRTGTLPTASASALTVKPQTPPMRAVTTPAVSGAPVINPGGVAAAMAGAGNPAAPVVNPGSMVTTPTARPAQTVNQPAPDAFNAVRKTSTGGAETWQPSEIAPNGGRWVPTTMGLQANGQVGPNMAPIHVGGGGTQAPDNVNTLRDAPGDPAARAFFHKPDSGPAVAAAPAPPGTYGAPGTVTRGSASQPVGGGRVFDEHGDQTAKVDAFAYPRAGATPTAPQVLPPARGALASAPIMRPAASPSPVVAAPAVAMTPPSTAGGPQPPAMQAGAQVGNQARAIGNTVRNEFDDTFVSPIKNAGVAVQNFMHGVTGNPAVVPAYTPIKDRNQQQPAPAPMPIAPTPTAAIATNPPMAMPKTIEAPSAWPRATAPGFPSMVALGNGMQDAFDRPDARSIAKKVDTDRSVDSAPAWTQTAATPASPLSIRTGVQSPDDNLSKMLDPRRRKNALNPEDAFAVN